MNVIVVVWIGFKQVTPFESCRKATVGGPGGVGGQVVASFYSVKGADAAI